MAPRTHSKEERMAIRIRPRDKKILEKAAGLSGVSLSAFVLSHSVKAAQDEITYQDGLKLSDQEWNTLIEALETSSKPNKSLVAGFKRYRYDQAAHPRLSRPKASETAAAYTTDDPEILKAWITEAENRYDEYLTGKVNAVPAFASLKKIRAKYQK